MYIIKKSHRRKNICEAITLCIGNNYEITRV